MKRGHRPIEVEGDRVDAVMLQLCRLWGGPRTARLVMVCGQRGSEA